MVHDTRCEDFWGFLSTSPRTGRERTLPGTLAPACAFCVCSMKPDVYVWASWNVCLSPDSSNCTAGKRLSIHQVKTMEDVRGKPVCKMRHKVIDFNRRIEVYAPTEDTPRIIVGQEIKLVQWFKQVVITAAVKNISSGETVEVTMTSDVHGQEAFVKLGPAESDHVIARIRMPLSFTHFVLSKQDYYVEVARGVDTSLAVIMAVILDEAVRIQSVAHKSVLEMRYCWCATHVWTP